MAVEFRNFDYMYEPGGKPVFAPSDLGRRIGDDIKAQIECAYVFDDFIYHLRKNGGHVAALHAHRSHQFFARVDIRRFFYSIARNRVRRALSGIGIKRSVHYAKWSCVRNPHGTPRYALPYGFVQSPILATLVLMESGVGAFLRTLVADGQVLASVYMDDISLSSDDPAGLQSAFEQLLVCLEEAGFQVSEKKVHKPGPAIDVFNCDLKCGHTAVRQDRIELFQSEPRSQLSTDAFEHYRQSVEHGNT